MRYPVSVRVRTIARRAFVAAVAGTVLVGQILAAGPWLAGPSVLGVTEKGAFSGGGFVPAAVVQLRAQDPTGSQSLVPLQVAADGTVTAEVTPAVEGLHTVAILDAAGAVLASTAFISRP